MFELSTSFKPQLIKVADAAALLHVSTSTIHNWIKNDAIPYIELPKTEGHRTEYRIPLQGLIASLSGNYDLATDLTALVNSAQEAGVDADAVIAATGGEPDTGADE